MIPELRRFYGVMAGIAFVMGIVCVFLYGGIKGNLWAAAGWWCMGIILICVSFFGLTRKKEGDILDKNDNEG